ncbi:P-loop containing nucleoside triphosphate hydrolase protein [Mycena sp. CBHHK59/15]|nr:P-loop containing nucleoside triphosphate hydrolase protein [Mycena sp. CBHHK59/15]
MKKQGVRQDGRTLEEIKLGVWRVLLERESSVDLAARWKNFTNMIPSVQTFISDVYLIGPSLVSLICLAKVWSSLENIFLLHFSSRILSIVEVGLTEGRPDTRAIVNAVVARMLVVGISAIIDWWSVRIITVMQNRVTHHFEDLVFCATLRTDMPTIHDNSSDSSLSAEPVWETFMNLVSVAAAGIEVIGLLAYIFRIAVSGRHGPVFVLLCVGKPLVKFLFRQSLWERAYVVEGTDANFLRLRALRELGETKYRQDILSGNIIQYILREFDKAREGLGDTSTGYPAQQYDNLESVGFTTTVELLGDLPMLYYAANAVLNPARFTLTSIAMLQQSEARLRRTFYNGMFEVAELNRGMTFMKRIYELSNITNVIKDGELRYRSTDPSKTVGMSLELRKVSFSYPGTSSAKALDNVSFSIKPGQLVVLVGANGSGKSTIVKLIARLYDVTSGQVVLDGKDIRHYKISDLRETIASLTQDHHLYPLSLAENIGLGNPEQVSDMDLILDSAKKGGANGFVSKLGQGFSTILDPKGDQYSVNVQSSDNTPLAKEMDKLEKTIDISGTDFPFFTQTTHFTKTLGGERQRVVASRTFMRFTSGNVKLMIADEGSSALDPEGEWELFKNLRDQRKGKTMVFVTHRFGHLTKYADLILCMKNGRLFEFGTHEELMKIPDGEYYKLYDIQARAFNS